jgi:uncharacterized protein YjbI with pentapeptide repeats
MGLDEKDLSGADLSKSSLTNARLSGADMQRTILDWADLRGADLRNATLRSARLVETDFGRANLCGTDFTGCRSIELANFKGSVGDDGTQWPQGFDPNSAGVIQRPSLSPAEMKRFRLADSPISGGKLDA